jgi:hypothetical protein
VRRVRETVEKWMVESLETIKYEMHKPPFTEKRSDFWKTIPCTLGATVV